MDEGAGQLDAALSARLQYFRTCLVMSRSISIGGLPLSPHAPTLDVFLWTPRSPMERPIGYKMVINGSARGAGEIGFNKNIENPRKR